LLIFSYIDTVAEFEQESDSQNLVIFRQGPGCKNFQTRTELEYENVTPATSG